MQLEQKHVSISVDEAARRWIAKKGYDPKMGARPMARIIQEHIKRPLAEELLFGKLVNGGHVEVTLSEDGEKLKCSRRSSADQPELLSHESESSAKVLGPEPRPGWRATFFSDRGRRFGPWSDRRASFPP